MVMADHGLTMIIAPAYILHAKFGEIFSWLTLGMTEYLWQGVLLIIMMLIVQRARISYLFAFITAVFFGVVFDGCLALSVYLPITTALRFVYYFAGEFICSLGVAIIFRSYVTPEVHELLVKEIADRFGKKEHSIEIGYDVFCCVFAIVLGLVFFGKLVGVGWGTVVCAVVNGPLIGMHLSWLNKRFEFVDVLPLRRIFER